MTSTIIKYIAIVIVSLVIGGFATQAYYKPAINELKEDIRIEREESKIIVINYSKQIDSLSAQIDILSEKRGVINKKIAEGRRNNNFDTSYNKNLRVIKDYDSLIIELRKIYN